MKTVKKELWSLYYTSMSYVYICYTSKDTMRKISANIRYYYHASSSTDDVSGARMKLTTYMDAITPFSSH